MNEVEKLIRELLLRLALPFEEAEFLHDEESNLYWFHIKMSDAGIMLSKNAEPLRALNYLTRKLLEKVLSPDDVREVSVIIDVNGHARKRVDSLKTTAHMMAERARFFKRDVEVPAMPPEDRKIIHTFLKKYDDIETESEGQGPSRRVVVRYKENNEENNVL